MPTQKKKSISNKQLKKLIVPILRDLELAINLLPNPLTPSQVAEYLAITNQILTNK